jgi:hypothetical protein
MPFTVSGRVTDYALTRHDIPKRDRHFSLSYSQDAGWDDPDSLVLAALRAEAATLTSVEHTPIPQHQGRIPPTFEDAPAESWVRSTVVAVVWAIAEKIKWEVTNPIGESDVDDPLVVF